MIPYGRQDVDQADIEAVLEVLRSDFLTQGPAVARFEQSLARTVNVRHAVAVNSATSALHIACAALGLGPGDCLWTSPNTFVASANCALYCGANVDFVDIDRATWNISVTKLREKLAQAKKSGTLPKILVSVHFAGQPPEQEAIWELAREYGFKVLEDAAHALGASRQGEPVGSCRWSDVTTFSFHPVKIITTGEGGAAVTNDTELARRMIALRSHGITKDPELFEAGPAAGAWHYEQQILGWNYRITDIQAALGASQLTRLEDYIDRRNALAERYNRAFAALPIRVPTVLPGNRSAFHLYVVLIEAVRAGRSRREVFERLRSLGVGVNVHYMPVHLQPFYRRKGFSKGQYPEAESYGESTITLPLYPTLALQRQDEVISALADAVTQAPDTLSTRGEKK